MLVSNGKITMSSAEAQEFASATFAPWTPRTIAEFNAMCDLGSARHLADNTGGQGYMFALEAEGMKFGENGEVNFPMKRQKMAYLKLHGVWPSEEQIQAFDGARPASAPTLAVVPKG
jgi:hypothetical protein